MAFGLELDSVDGEQAYILDHLINASKSKRSNENVTKFVKLQYVFTENRKINSRSWSSVDCISMLSRLTPGNGISALCKHAFRLGFNEWQNFWFSVPGIMIQMQFSIIG